MRKLTVSTLRRQNGNLYQTTYSEVPYIRLAGNWLTAAGITPGQKVHVHAIGNGLWITPPAIVQERSVK